MKAHNLSYKHRQWGPYFFKGISFALERGKLHALHGKNRTGKSVLLNLLCGNRLPGSIVEGLIAFDGKICIVNQRFDRMICDRFGFDDNLRFACIGGYPSIFRGLKPFAEYPRLIDRFSIDRTKPVHLLSGGQRQILALFMVLQKPIDYLLLDEPTATLDEENAEMVFEFLKELTHQGVTVLAVCHDKELIERFVTGRSLRLPKMTAGVQLS